MAKSRPPRHDAVSSRGRLLPAWGAFALWVAMVVALIALSAGGGGGPEAFVWPILNAGFPLAAILILARQPGNRIGWILMAIGLLTAQPLGAYGGFAAANDLPGAALALVLNGPMWAPPILLMGTVLLLRFPDGNLLTRRWRWVERFSIGLIVFTVGLFAVTPGDLAYYGHPELTNPLGIDALAGVLNGALALLVLIGVAMLVSAASLVIRFRRSKGVQRQQLKWLTAAAAVVAGVYLFGMVASVVTGAIWGDSDPAWLEALNTASTFLFVLIPISIGIAILRYRLYEIDRIISRTLGYAIVTAILAATFAGLVLGLQALARPITGSSQVAVAVSTLAVAALFGPLRGRVQGAVDRRFNRSRYDAVKLSEGLAARLRDRVELDAVRDELASAAAMALQPAAVSIWLRASAPVTPRHEEERDRIP